MTDPFDPAVQVDPRIGTLLHGKYRLSRRIGSGGFGTVYEALDERGAGNRVAIKVIRPEYAADQRLVRAFRAEARRMTRLSHPNIVDWKNFDADEQGTCYFAMELVEGVELDRVLAQEGPLPADRAARVLLQILEALRAAHHLAEGGSVLHLDLKPRNVFVLPGRDGGPEQVKVIDFGIGQHVGEEGDELAMPPGGAGTPGGSALADFNPSTLSFRDAALNDPPGMRRCQGCTPEYVSPEQAAHVMGRPNIVPLDGRSDLYSLGVMAFQMLTGELPFAQPIVRTDYLRLHATGQPRKLAATGAKVPRALARFVERCLQKDRDERYPDARAALAAMERVVRPPRALWIAAAAVVVAASAFSFGGYLMRGAGPAVSLRLEGTELGARNPVPVGPSRRSVRLTLPAAGLVETSDRLALVRADDGSPVAGGRVTVTGPTELLVELDQDPAVPRELLGVRVSGSSGRLAPFALLWLAPEAWSLESVRAGTSELGQAAQAIDPRGLSLEVAVVGEGRDDVRRIALDTRGGAPIEFVPAGVREQRRLLRASLDLLGLPGGPAQLRLRAEDLAGNVHELDLPVVVVDGPLEAASELCERGDDDGYAPYNQLGGRYLLTPSSRPVLRVDPTRRAAADWRVVLDGVDEEATWHHEEPAESHEIRLGDALATTEGVQTGRIELLIDERDLVVRSDPAAGGLVSDSLPFLLSDERADFVASLELGGARRVPLAEERTNWIGSPDAALVIERRGRLVMGIRLDDDRSGILAAGQQELSFPLQLEADGEQPLVIQAFRVDTADQTFADQPDAERRFQIGLDTTPPDLSLPPGLEDADWRELDAIPEAVAPVLAASGPAAPVRVDWRLGREIGGPSLEGTWVEGGQPISLCSRWSGEQTLPDGEWLLELAAKDEANNSAAPITARFQVALAGPELVLESPREGTWQSEAEGWLVQVRARDPNGVGEVTSAIMSEDGERLPVALDATAGTPADRELRGHVAIPHGWSSRPVQVVIEASDGAGKTGSITRDGIVLPTIAPPRPLAVRSTSGLGATLRLVPGNGGAQYLFGGRGDEVENAEHLGLGLRAFATGNTPRSWAVPYAPGEIGDFYLDEREVTRDEFLAFLRAEDGYTDLAHWPPLSGPPPESRRAELASLLASDPDLPVTGVTWEEAWACARWMGRRLPSWVELELAIRGGPSGYRPFASCRGRAPVVGELNAKDLGPGHAWAGGQGADVTPGTGLRDLAGNVKEWTSSPLLLPGDPERRERGAYFRSRRLEMLSGEGGAAAESFWVAGGSYLEQNYFFEAAAARPRRWSAEHVGFRCALSIADVRSLLERGDLEETQ